MSIECINKLLCEQSNLISTLCDQHTTIVDQNEDICEKISELVGDPDAPCPECEVTEPVEEAVAQTAAIKEVTVKVQAEATAIKTRLTTKTKSPEVAVRGE